MAQVTFDCPHCHSKNMTTTVTGFVVVPYEAITAQQIAPFAVGFGACSGCWSPIGFRFTSTEHKEWSEHVRFADYFQRAAKAEHNITAGFIRAKVVHTPNTNATVPDHLPPTVEKAFKSAERNYVAEDGEDAAAMLYRRAIDIAIREKHPEIKGNLALRIEKLVGLGLLPPSMKSWSDQIRLIGNGGAHEPEGVTKEELKPMRGFTEAFLRYFITIPFEVALARGEIDERGMPVQQNSPTVSG
ncbi:MAG: DUF4145 domain-containing protein [Nitratireductor sp.]|uniref:DUF4145 domain-containing protein n=1 Tax=Nitratireductor sp. TaxID=1872084 RepID=UPI002623CB20|nr:DUF4145 domain-containing protein [Nitratireductor sp.]MCV0348470.1 DUF4145 domain-containing protein [Nitratireductor sp.]